jgi:hypothetical protein
MKLRASNETQTPLERLGSQGATLTAVAAAGIEERARAVPAVAPGHSSTEESFAERSTKRNRADTFAIVKRRR